MKKFFVLLLILISTNLISSDVTTKEKTQIQWVDGLYTKSITDEFIISSKDFSKSTKTGDTMMIPLGSGDFSGDGIPEFVYGMLYVDLKKGSFIKPIFLTISPGKGLSLFKPIMDVVPYVSNPRDTVIADFNGDGINDIFIADTGVDYDPFPGYQNSLILSAPNGKFINATSNLPQILDFTHGATSGDIDSDGDIDLFVTQAGSKEEPPHYFLRNNGKGVFTQVKVGELLDKRYSYLSHTQNLKKKKNLYYMPGLEFIDDDDKLDLILLSGKLEGRDNKIIFGSNSGFKKKNALKLKSGRFGNKSIGYNYLVTDIDDDGDNDIIILHVTFNFNLGTSHVGSDIQVLIQEKNRKFVDKSNFYFPGITFDYGSFGFSINLIDINNDNKKDLTIFGYHGINDPFKQKIKGEIKQAPPKVFIRQDDGSFRPLNNDLLIGDDKYTFGGIRPLDIDNDGDIEFVVHNEMEEREFSVQIVELTTNKDEAMYQSNKPTEIIASALFDGRYSFSISRYNEKEGSKMLGNGYIKIQNGIMTVERENRTLLNGTVDLYDTFEGKIDKKGNINSSLKISALFGDSADLENVNLLGNIDELLKGPWDDYYDITVKLEKKGASAIPRAHEDFSSEEIVFLMTADGEDEKCIRDQLGPGLDLLRKDTIYHKRYSRPVIYTWIKKIVKDCSN